MHHHWRRAAGSVRPSASQILTADSSQFLYFLCVKYTSEGLWIVRSPGLPSEAETKMFVVIKWVKFSKQRIRLFFCSLCPQICGCTCSDFSLSDFSTAGGMLHVWHRTKLKHHDSLRGEVFCRESCKALVWYPLVDESRFVVIKACCHPWSLWSWRVEYGFISERRICTCLCYTLCAFWMQPTSLFGEVFICQICLNCFTFLSEACLGEFVWSMLWMPYRTQGCDFSI